MSDIEQFITKLDTGEVRAAQRNDDGEWIVNIEVKQRILEIFKQGILIDVSEGGFPFFDKHTLPLKRLTLESRCSSCARRQCDTSGCFCCKRSDLYAADVH
jgi:hypothetical protein